jgi:hypothetical protein
VKADFENLPFMDLLTREPKKAAAVLLLVLAVIVLAGWQSGLIQRIRSPEADLVTLHTGAFGSLLTVSAESKWGTYRVTVRRGEDYPAAGEDILILLENTESIEQRAAVNAVVNGEIIYIRTEDSQRNVLDAEPFTLRPLLTAEDKAIAIEIPGHMKTRFLTLSLEPGLKR